MPDFERIIPKGDDPVQNMVPAFSAHGMTDWLVNHHHLPEGSRKTVESNLQEQFRWHRMQGRLDRGGWLNFFATLMGLKQSPHDLKTPENFWNNDNENR